MRIRATVAVVTGALALSALTVPTTQAAPTADRPGVPSYGSATHQGTGAASKGNARAAAEAPVINKAVVNGGKPIVVGATAVKKVTLSITASHPEGIAASDAIIWIGSSLDDPEAFGFGATGPATCVANAANTTSTCTQTIEVDPLWLVNSDSKTWNVGAYVLANDGYSTQSDKFAKTSLQRLSKLDVNAAPEPVKKGGTITVTGKLSRANWETGTYKGYATQSVQLQFRKSTSTSYTTLKTVKTSTTGTLKTTVKASVDGYWRWNFAGTSTTPAIVPAGDFVDVK
ncbi:calcium-binding protein [Streptomyces sp. NBC_01498]|uniref:calcium-binding protein n=1 Tax=Streptomyces sp. NBC_01498 TaxID=2975870 RepID=UPI002E7BBE54|nr:calcium-binding protein [Streptomyces sp. NBC_01498]WTL26231.1 calcium-binding protein [Streptomyces sp. NBC_01498]